MYSALILFLVSLVFFAVIGQLFIKNIIISVLNGLVIYLLLYRAYYDLSKRDWRPYAFGLLVGVLVAMALPPLIPLWDITIVLVVVFIVVESHRGLTRKSRK